MHKKETSFEELKKTWRDKKALLKRYAESCKGEIIETHDDLGIIVHIAKRVSPGYIIYTLVGSNLPEVYDELLTMVMSSHGWKTIEEMKVWIDLNMN